MNKAVESKNFSFGTIFILRQQRDWVGGVRKMAIFADVQLNIYADVG